MKFFYKPLPLKTNCIRGNHPILGAFFAHFPQFYVQISRYSSQGCGIEMKSLPFAGPDKQGQLVMNSPDK